MQMDVSKVPVEIIFNSARNEILSAVEKAHKVYGVPGYMLRGYLFEALAQVDDQREKEMSGAYGKLIDTVQQQATEAGKTEEKKDPESEA